MQHNLNILIVDDDILVLEKLRNILIKEGFKEHTMSFCRDYHEGIDAIQKKSFAIAILDQDLTDKSGQPFGSGTNLAQRIRIRNAFTQIIFITSYSYKPEFRDAFSFTQHMEIVDKPIGENTFPRILRRGIEGYLRNKKNLHNGFKLPGSSVRIKSIYEVFYIEVIKANKKCLVHLIVQNDLKVIEVSGTLSGLNKAIDTAFAPGSPIIQCHASYLINGYYVDKVYSKKLLSLTHPENPELQRDFEVTRTYRTSLFKRLSM